VDGNKNNTLKGAGNWGGWFGRKNASWLSGYERSEGGVETQHVWIELQSEGSWKGVCVCVSEKLKF